MAEQQENMRIWAKVEKTNPAYTKKVTQRGGFTAISAQYQILEATQQFGPIGEGWGYDAGLPILMDGLVVVPVTLWHGSRDNRYGPMPGGAELKTSNGKIDSDAPKKATTDALTKLLSQLGFNADVFLGKFDDNKYVAEMTREFAGENGDPKTPEAKMDDPDYIDQQERKILAFKTVADCDAYYASRADLQQHLTPPFYKSVMEKLTARRNAVSKESVNA